MLASLRVATCGLLLGLLAGAAAAGPNVALDNILLSKVNGVTKLEIWPGCTMRYVDHSPAGAGLELRIRVALDPACEEIFTDIASERYAPSSLRLGNVDEVLFDKLSERDTFITLKFREPQKFEVRQHQVGWIEVFVDTNVASASLPAAKPAPLATRTAPSPPVPRSLPEVTDRRSVQPRASARINVPPSSDGDFVIQLGVFSNPDPAIAALERSASPHFAYVTRFEVNGTVWHGLKLGFFDSEAQAEQVLSGLVAQFPDAWIRVVEEAERSTARAGGEIRDRMARETPAVRVTRVESPGAAVLDNAMIEGRRALLEQRYAEAIRHYTEVLESPGHGHGPEAREMLGLALERSGNTRGALAEYRAFLNEHPEHLMAGRVTERLTSLETAFDRASADASARRVSQRSAGSDGWTFHGGLSHYYWRNQEQVVHDGNYRVSSSGVLGLADMTAARRGERFDLLARFNGAYQHNLVDFDATGNIGWVSDAFIDVRDHRWDWQGRFGRQTRREDGVPGRFDGFGLSYDWRPDIAVSLSAGIPVDSPRFVSRSERAFVAGSVRIEDLWDGRISASVYTHQQTVDGIYDRQAVGGEFAYREGSLTAISLVDYDASYNVLNTFLTHLHWRLDNGWVLTGRIDVGALPYLTTRNALSGQSATTIDELLDTFSEGQVRRLARDRTAQATTGALGATIPFGERFDLSIDVSLRQSDGTEASGGVAAIPDAGNQVFFNAMLVGTNLLRRNDLMMLSVRSSSTRSRDTYTLIADARLPFGRTLRINPRLRVDAHSPNVGNASEQLVVTPAVRILYRFKRVLIDLEAGARWSSRELPPLESDPFTPDGTEELLGGFVNLGYRLEF